MHPWADYLKQITTNAPTSRIAARVYVDKSTISRWIALEKPPAEAVIAICVAYNADVLVGLIVSGHITREYVESGVETRLMYVPTRFMTNELERRTREEYIASAVPEGLDPSPRLDG